jgi:hypothetical protein
MTATTSLETLLRECSLDYGHIQLFRSEEGWQASIYHYSKHEPMTCVNSKVSSDPVNALRAALVEDERRARDLTRRYEAAAKVAAVVADEFEDLFG